KGVKVKILAPVTKEAEKSVKELSGLAELRNSKELGRFMIVDDKEVLFMLHNDKDVHKNYDTAVWVNSAYFASTLSSMFDSAWKRN
ncbi:hypothetical protein KY316_03660, partial [Candidatus Woesearchaeota archaeon]|nr:hypothetical protein [Candidatus Woesearchaeota archaeon]